LVKAPSYFEHTENKYIPDIKRYDVVEWEDPDHASPIHVEESRNTFKLQAFKRRWKKFTGYDV
jgi:hypothetical protein